jgi:hydroxymethylpyrimidine pyrophosphatase-like HAD family hydrolase
VPPFPIVKNAPFLARGAPSPVSRSSQRLRARAFKLLAVDLDGTLLDHRGRPHESDVRALRALARTGVPVTILTGRLWSGTRMSAEAIGATGPVGCADGSHIVRASDQKTLHHNGLRGDHARVVRDALARNGPASFVFANDTIVHDSAGESFLPYVRTWSQDVRRADAVIAHEAWDADEGVTAVVAVGTAEQIHGTSEDVERLLGRTAQVAIFPIRRLPDTWGMVARAGGGSKGTALGYVAKHHGCTVEETVCVGDWLNDVSMFAVAGRSYAMGQAPDEVKRAASMVLEETSEAGGGIARVVEEAFGVRDE